MYLFLRAFLFKGELSSGKTIVIYEIIFWLSFKQRHSMVNSATEYKQI